MENDINVKIRQIDKLYKSVNGTSTDFNKSDSRLSRKDNYELRVEPVKQRASSLTEGHKCRKSVSFADNFGIGVDIRVYDSNLPPEVPDYVLSNLTKCRSHSPPDVFSEFSYKHNFISIDERNLPEKVKLKTVCLSRLIIMNDLVYGMVAVSNICAEKIVFIRFTTNKWATYTDCDSKFCSILSPNIDQFSFQICLSSLSGVGYVTEFAICYKCAGREFWDNNNNTNYQIIKYISQN